MERVHRDQPKPLPHSYRDELADAVAADVGRHADAHEQVPQPLQDILADPLPRYVDGEKLAVPDYLAIAEPAVRGTESR